MLSRNCNAVFEPSYIQFGFKSGTSTTQAVIQRCTLLWLTLVRHLIEYVNLHDSNGRLLRLGGLIRNFIANRDTSPFGNNVKGITGRFCVQKECRSHFCFFVCILQSYIFSCVCV